MLRISNTILYDMLNQHSFDVNRSPWQKFFSSIEIHCFTFPEEYMGKTWPLLISHNYCTASIFYKYRFLKETFLRKRRTWASLHAFCFFLFALLHLHLCTICNFALYSWRRLPVSTGCRRLNRVGPPDSSYRHGRFTRRGFRSMCNIQASINSCAALNHLGEELGNEYARTKGRRIVEKDAQCIFDMSRTIFTRSDLIGNWASKSPSQAGLYHMVSIRVDIAVERPLNGFFIRKSETADICGREIYMISVCWHKYLYLLRSRCEYSVNACERTF